jgi:hypothetical protein
MRMSEWLSTGSDNPYATPDELSGLMQTLEVGGKPYYEPRADANDLADAIIHAFVHGRLQRSIRNASVYTPYLPNEAEHSYRSADLKVFRLGQKQGREMLAVQLDAFKIAIPNASQRGELVCWMKSVRSMHTSVTNHKILRLTAT